MVYLAFTPLMPKADLVYFSKTIDTETFKSKMNSAHEAEELRTCLFMNGMPDTVLNLNYTREVTGIDLEPILREDVDGWHNQEGDALQAGDTLLLMLAKKVDLFMVFADKQTRLDNFEFREIYCGDPKTMWAVEYE